MVDGLMNKLSDTGAFKKKKKRDLGSLETSQKCLEWK
jgi:hypothetical protein